jgi:oligosaccharide repeat unit polymerase
MRIMILLHHRRLVSSVAVLCIGLMAVGAGYVSSALALSWWLVGFNALLLVLFVLERRRTAGRIDAFEPLVIFVASWSLFFVARPIAMLFADEFALGPLDARAGFNGALAMAAVGTIGFAFGYTGRMGAVAGRRIRARDAVPHRGLLIAAAISCSLVGLILFVVFLSSGGGGASLGTLFGGRSATYRTLFSGTSAYVFYGVYFCFPAALALYWQSLRDGSRVLRLVAFCASLPPIAVSFFAGTRSWLVPMFLAYLVLRYLHYRRRPGFLTVLFTSFLIFFIGIAFIGNYRNVTTRDKNGTQQVLLDTIGSPTRSSSAILRSGDTEMVALLSLVKQTVPTTIDYRYGTATGELFVRYVPRRLWKDKPRAGDEIFTRTVLSNSYFGGAPRQYTPLANFYLDFGYVGILIGMAMLGLLARAHFELLFVNSEAATRQLLYAATFPLWLPLLRGSLADAAGRLFFVLPPILTILFISTRYAAERRRAALTAMTSERGSGA